MGLSLVKNYLHITFSTRKRIPILKPPVDKELHHYIGGICNNLDCQVITVGGYTDHVHVLCMLSKKMALCDLMREMKASSSKWIKTKGPQFSNFAWQEGYGAFCVGPGRVDEVTIYIQNQFEHHRQKTFQEEFLAFLSAYKIEFDERYLWD